MLQPWVLNQQPLCHRHKVPDSAQSHFFENEFGDVPLSLNMCASMLSGSLLTRVLLSESGIRTVSQYYEIIWVKSKNKK